MSMGAVCENPYSLLPPVNQPRVVRTYNIYIWLPVLVRAVSRLHSAPVNQLKKSECISVLPSIPLMLVLEHPGQTVPVTVEAPGVDAFGNHGILGASGSL